MVEDIIALAANPHTNIYIEQRVVRKGTKGRGRKADTLAVLALVDDGDADAAKGTTELPVQPTEVIQTSAKNRQLRYQFADPPCPRSLIESAKSCARSRAPMAARGPLRSLSACPER
jgi:hypothetical protein